VTILAAQICFDIAIAAALTAVIVRWADKFTPRW